MYRFRLFLFTLLLPALLPAQELPDGFFDITYLSGFDFPTGITFDEEGRMFVWEKKGTVHLVDTAGNIYPEPFVDISEEVSNWKDHGLMAFVLDNDFSTNGFCYLLYALDLHHYNYYGTPDYHPDSTVTWQPTIGRVVRYRADPTTAYQTVLPESRKVLLGETLQDGIPLMYEFHGLGSMLMAEDRSLLISTGDGTSNAGPDTGGDEYGTMASKAVETGIITSDQDVGSYRSQHLGNLNGKILRISAETGQGLPSNPYYDAAAPASSTSRIWSWGLRNPYRIQLRPNTGSHYTEDGDPGDIFVGDVGNGAWEELNIVTEGGQNFGWPIMEGIGSHWPYINEPAPPYQLRPNPLYGNGCDQEYFTFQDLYVNPKKGGHIPPANPCNGGELIEGYSVGQMPVLAWSNARWNKPTRAQVPVFSDNGFYTGQNIGTKDGLPQGEIFDGYSALAGVFYQGDNFPPRYQGQYFMVDFSGWIKVLEFSEANELQSVEPFHDFAKDIIHLAENPADGKLYYLNLEGEVRQISFGGNPPPVAVIEADRFFGPAPLQVQFDGTASYDSNLPVTGYEWDFGDGSSSNEAQPVHTFAASNGNPASYTVRLTVTDSLGEQNTATRVVSPNNTPPQVDISSFQDGDRYPLDQGTIALRLAAEVTDAEHKDEDLLYEWRVFLHHNAHFHPEPVDYEHESFALISPLGCEEEEYWYRIALTVTDPMGLGRTDERLIYPHCGDAFAEFSELQARPIDGGVRLDWSTQLEGDIAYFELQRSRDARVFRSLGRLSPKGSNTDYQAVDDSPVQGTNHYRVKAVTTDGAFRYTNTATIGYPEPLPIRVYPNPVNSRFTVELLQAQSSSLQLELLNAAGQQVLSRRWEATAGQPLQEDILITNLPNGVYYYRLQNGDTQHQGRIMIARQ